MPLERMSDPYLKTARAKVHLDALREELGDFSKSKPHRRQAGTAIGENQAQRLALQSAPVEILQQRLPVGLAFALAA